MEKEIKAHTTKLESGDHTPYSNACPHCAYRRTEGRFRVHQCRRRFFRAVVEDCVTVFRSWILRLKCPNCGRTFTDYPPFRLAIQAVCQRDDTEQSEDLSRNAFVLPENGSAPGEVPCL